MFKKNKNVRSWARGVYSIYGEWINFTLFAILAYISIILMVYLAFAVDNYVKLNGVDSLLGFGYIFGATMILQIWRMTRVDKGEAISSFLTGFWCAMMAIVVVGIYLPEKSWYGLLTPLPAGFIFWDVFFFLKRYFDL